MAILLSTYYEKVKEVVKLLPDNDSVIKFAGLIIGINEAHITGRKYKYNETQKERSYLQFIENNIHSHLYLQQ